MLQLPHMDAGLLKKLSRNGVKQLADLMGMDSIARLQALQSAGDSPAMLIAASAVSALLCHPLKGLGPAGVVHGARLHCQACAWQGLPKTSRTATCCPGGHFAHPHGQV